MKESVPNFNLLMVEDNPADIRLMLEAAKKAHLQEIAAVKYEYSAVKALEHLDAAYELGTSFDMILLDLNMPKVNGREFLARIKRNERHSHIPVFIMTNSDYPVDIEDCLQLGAEAYFQKPNDFERLIDFFRSVKDSLDFNRDVSVAWITRRYSELSTAA